jgi:hypothetical protein
MKLRKKLKRWLQMLTFGIVILFLFGCNEDPPRARIRLAGKCAISLATLHGNKPAFLDALRLWDPKHGVGDSYDITLFVTRPGIKKMKAVLLKEESGAQASAIIEIETERIWNEKISDDFIEVTKPEVWLDY